MEELTRGTAKALLPPRNERQAKWTFGRVLLCCGSAAMPGAAVISTRAALRSGVGLCELASVPAALLSLPATAPECILCPMPEGSSGSIAETGLPVLLRQAERCSALLCGCGLTVCDDTRALVRGLLAHFTGILVLDADAINIVSEEPALLKTAAGQVLLTPHARELSRLLHIREAGIPEAIAFAAEMGVTLLCKSGTGAAIVGPGGPVYFLEAPNSGMAKGGSGDVLAGLTAGLAAQGLLPERAAALGAFLHAEAGRLARERYGARAMQPTDVIDSMGAAFLTLE
ncbi:MAG: NAD(P)H-hydrate dehydratase [Clostridiaceae bacterium]|nr:NAD(P)H-hydrate dehydratase [Clostridiaceae bacterium]